jgi:hypothetical protein
MDTGHQSVDSMLDHPDNLLNRLALPSRSRDDLVELPAELQGRRKRGRPTNPIPFPERVLIGVSAHLDSNKNVSQAFNVSRGAVSHHKNAEVGGRPESPVNGPLKAAVEAGLAPLREKVANKIDNILNKINEPKIEELGKESVQRIASAALTLATLHEKLTPKGAGDQGNRVQVNVGNFSAGEQKESDYESVEVPLVLEVES